MDFMETLDRVTDIRHAETPGSYIKQRLAESAGNLSKAGELQARVEVINEALTKFVQLLYQADTDGGFCNVDCATFRVLIPAPFGSAGWKRWGLRSWEATALRRFLSHRCTEKGKRPALFEYNFEARTWHLNALDYSTFEAAGHYLKREPMTVKMLRQLSSDYRQDRVAVASRNRQNANKL